MSLKVAADKYEKRAVYVRKKYQQLVEKTSNNSENSFQGPPDKLRLQHTTLKKTAKQKDEKLQEKEDEI